MLLIRAVIRLERAMERIARTIEQLDDADELVNDRIPGMPLLGFVTGTVLSLVIWGALAVIAWSV